MSKDGFLLQARVAQVRGAGKIVYICEPAAGCCGNGDATMDVAFSSFVTLFHCKFIFHAVAARVNAAVFITAVCSIYSNVCRKNKALGEEPGSES